MKVLLWGAGAIGGAGLMFIISMSTTQFVVPLIQQHLYWYSWYNQAPFLSLLVPIGVVLGLLSAFIASWAKKNQAFAGAVGSIGSYGVILITCSWFLCLIVNNYIIENFRQGPLGATFHYLAPTAVWYWSYYGVPTLWAVGLAFKCHQFKNST